MSESSWTKLVQLFKTYRIHISIAAALFCIAVLVILTSKTISTYDDKGYTGNNETKGVDLHTFFLQANRECKDAGDTTNKNHCYENVATLVERHVHSRDLVAQETMASGTRGILFFTGWLTFVSFLALFFTAVGLWLVRQTLRENIKSFEHIQATSVAELRPYIDITRSNPVLVYDERRDYTCIQFSLTYRNTGKTPAKDFTFFEPISGTVILRRDSTGDEARITSFECPAVNKRLLPKYIAPEQGRSRYTSVKLVASNVSHDDLLKKVAELKCKGNGDDWSVHVSIKGIVRFKEEFVKKSNKHHAITIIVNGINSTPEIIIDSEDTCADEHHYAGYS